MVLHPVRVESQKVNSKILVHGNLTERFSELFTSLSSKRALTLLSAQLSA
jgi:hypothetical protein